MLGKSWNRVRVDGQYRIAIPGLHFVRFWIVASQQVHVIWGFGTLFPWPVGCSRCRPVSSTFSPDGRKIATGLIDLSDLEQLRKGVNISDVATGQIPATLGQTDVVQEIACSTDGNKIATKSTHVAEVWDVAKSSPPSRTTGRPETSMAFFPDGSKVAMARDSWDGGDLGLCHREGPR